MELIVSFLDDIEVSLGQLKSSNESVTDLIVILIVNLMFLKSWSDILLFW